MTTATAELLGVCAAAAALGCHASTISRYLKDFPDLNQGSKGRPKIDVDALRRHRQETTNPSQQRGRHAAVNALPPVAAPATTKPDASPNYAMAKAVRETVLAQRARVDLDQKRGLLVSRREVEDAVYDAGARLQRDLLALGSQLAERLANMADKQEIETLLTTEYRQVLAALASSLRADADAAAEDQARPRCEIGPLDPRRPK